MNVVDSSGWIEHFQHSTRAAFFSGALSNMADLVVPSLAIYEVHRRLSPWLPSALMNDCLEVMQAATVIDLTATRAIAASEAAQKHKLAMADASCTPSPRSSKPPSGRRTLTTRACPGCNTRQETNPCQGQPP